MKDNIVYCVVAFVAGLIIPTLVFFFVDGWMNPGAQESIPAVYKSIPTSLKGPMFGVIVYQGHEYLVQSKGGMVHAESCPCRGK